MKLNLKIIGIAHSPLKRPEDCPLQENESSPEAVIEIYTEFQEAMKDIRAGDELILFTWLHKAGRTILTTRPRNNPNATLTGIFSTRSPDRPNPIGIHFVKVTTMQDNKFQVSGPEVLDQTPIIDIKPDLRNKKVVS